MLIIQGVQACPRAGTSAVGGLAERRTLVGALLCVGVVAALLWAATSQAGELTDAQANRRADLMVAQSFSDMGQTAIESSIQPGGHDDKQKKSDASDPYADGAYDDDDGNDPYADDAYADDAADTPAPAASSSHRDPFEKFNRTVFTFNEFMDRWLLRPVARGYVKITPDPVRVGINNFLGNLFAPTTIINDLLQARPAQGMRDTGRFLINLVVGFGGIFDPASEMGMPPHSEDFGQTLGYWGAKPGPYLMLPLLGPSDFRDGVGRIADYPTSPFQYMDDNDTRLAIGVVGAINTRANLLSVDRLLEQSFDPYAFAREAYLNSRAAAIKN